MTRINAIEEKSEQRLEGGEGLAVWMSEVGAFPAKGTASAKAGRQERIQHA